LRSAGGSTENVAVAAGALLQSRSASEPPRRQLARTRSVSVPAALQLVRVVASLRHRQRAGRHPACRPRRRPPLRQRSGGDPDQRQPRPLSTGYLPSNTAAAAAETQAALQRGVQGSAQVNGADTPVRLQNVALLPNRQLIQQPGTGGFLNFVLCSAMRCDKINAKGSIYFTFISFHVTSPTT